MGSEAEPPREYYTKLRKKTVKLQAATRGWLVRRLYNRLYISVLEIQSCNRLSAQ